VCRLFSPPTASRLGKVAVLAIRRVSSLPRGEKHKPKQLRVARGFQRVQLVRPAVTRWNSHTRAAARILEFEKELFTIAPLSPEETVSLKLFVLTTTPISWATDAVQGDDATMLHAWRVLDALEARLQELEDITQDLPTETRQAMHEMLGIAKNSLHTRKAQYLVNDLSLFLRRTDATSKEQLSPEESEWLASFVQRYFLKVKIPLTAHDLHSEINQFSNRTLQDRLDNDAFWKRNTLA
jgi:hypothetical protein